MTYENFTVSAQDAILKGQRLAASLSQEEVQTAHLLIGIIDADEIMIPELFKAMNINMPLLKRELYNFVEKAPRVKTVEKQKLTPEANAMLTKSKKIMAELGDQYITPEVMVMGLADGVDAPAILLKGLGADAENIKKHILQLRMGKKVTDQANTVPMQNLNKYAKNLNAKAIEGSLTKITGRDEEIRRIIHILSRKTKNNPILVGDPGVGKSSVVEGIVWRIINKDVPVNLINKQIYALDLSSVIAGAKYKGEFEERLKFLLDEVKLSNGEVILYIEDIHTLIGAGGGNGAMDAAGILKPALSRGELFCIGSTTPEEYQKYFQTDKTLASKFQNIDISEPGIEETISILRGAQEQFEKYHKIAIRDEALKAAAELSSRYVTDRKLPDKAIDLIDEAASKLRMELDSVPDDIDELRRSIQQAEIEKELLKKEGSQSARDAVAVRIEAGKKQLQLLEQRWENERTLANTVQECKIALERLTDEMNILLEKGDHAAYAEKQAEEQTMLQKKLEDAEGKLAAIPEEERFTSGEVSADDIAEVISRWTGIPVKKMLQNDKDRLLNLEEEIGRRLIGQQEAVTAVCDAVRRSRAGLHDPNKPIGSFIFLGPTGVGKTELAKAMAEVLFDDENAITRIDMSEYQEKHAVSRLVGAPPGYVGYDEGGQLTEAVRRRPYTIVLLDEIEKAHPDTFNILLQLLDDGRLTDNRGRVANFRNTIIIMTSNMGAEKILENFEDLDALGEKHRADIIETTREEVLEILKENLRPEFLNRIDEKIVFTPLSRADVKKIAGLMLKKVLKNLSAQGIGIDFSESAMDLIVDLGYDPAFGARPLKRVIDKELVNYLAKEILGGGFKEGDTIYVGTDKKGFTFGKEKPIAEEKPDLSDKKQASPAAAKNVVKEVEKAANDLQQAVDEFKKEA